MGEINNYGDGGKQTYLNIQSMFGDVHSHTTVLILSPGDSEPTPAYLPSTTMDTEYYNLFVVGSEPFATDAWFTVPKNRALTDCMGEEEKAAFSPLTDASKSRIETFPSICANKNND
jgi:hypothetical protein